MKNLKRLKLRKIYSIKASLRKVADIRERINHSEVSRIWRIIEYKVFRDSYKDLVF